MNKKRLAYIDLIKMVMALLVMLFHYQGYFVGGCEQNMFQTSVNKILFTKILTPFLNGTLYVAVFCIMSGYLLSNKKITSLKELLIELAFRYLKLVILVMLTNIVVLLLQATFGFSSNTFALEYDNAGLYGHYYERKTLYDAIFTSFRFSTRLNGSVWMLSFLYIGNAAVLIKNYVTTKYSGINPIYVSLAIILFLLAYAYIRENVVFSLVTFLGSYLSNYKKQISKRELNIFIISILFIYYTTIIIDNRTIDNIIFSKHFSLLVALLFVLLIVNCKYIKEKYEKCYLIERLHLGELSLWVFLLHAPLVCSVSFHIYYRLAISFDILFYVILFLTIIIVIIASYLMRYLSKQIVFKQLSNIKQLLLDI